MSNFHFSNRKIRFSIHDAQNRSFLNNKSGKNHQTVFYYTFNPRFATVKLQISKGFLPTVLLKIYFFIAYHKYDTGINLVENKKAEILSQQKNLSFISRGRGIRTPINGFGDRCSAIELFP